MLARKRGKATQIGTMEPLNDAHSDRPITRGFRKHKSTSRTFDSLGQPQTSETLHTNTLSSGQSDETQSASSRGKPSTSGRGVAESTTAFRPITSDEEWSQYANRLEQSGEKIDVEYLIHVLMDAETSIKPKTKYQLRQHLDCISCDTDCSEVYPNLYVGDAASARNKSYLKILGITHVLNAAEGSRAVETNREYYSDMPRISYMGFAIRDLPTTDISQYFYTAAVFIDVGIKSGGKVLVHCHKGISRSATCAIAYLMIHQEMTVADAIYNIRLRRRIRPNDGFLKQLAKLDKQLQKERKASGEDWSHSVRTKPKKTDRKKKKKGNRNQKTVASESARHL